MDSLKFFDIISWAFYLSCNAFAVFLLWASKSRPALARIILFLLFLFASGVNAYVALHAPWRYRDYADSAMPLYKQFIIGVFIPVITPMVLTIALCQLIIALAMTAKGQMFRVGCWAAIIFCIAIAPLGLYAAFPMPLLLAWAIFRLMMIGGGKSGLSGTTESINLTNKHHARYITN